MVLLHNSSISQMLAIWEVSFKLSALPKRKSLHISVWSRGKILPLKLGTNVWVGESCRLCCTLQVAVVMKIHCAFKSPNHVTWFNYFSWFYCCACKGEFQRLEQGNIPIYQCGSKTGINISMNTDIKYQTGLIWPLSGTSLIPVPTGRDFR
jgi:hypothetical protein